MPPVKPLIVVIDDEPDIVQLVTLHLARGGFEVQSFASATPLHAFLLRRRPALIVLDLMLPDADGMDVCRSLKQDERTRSIPVLILSARGEEVDVVLGLEFGADDYVIKPFSPKELVARVRAVLRRNKGDEPEERPTVIEVGGRLRIDFSRHQASVDGLPVELTATEFAILATLARRPGWVFSREKILDALWGDEKAVLDRTIDVHIRNLREKMGSAAGLIRNVRGIGYKVEG
ncbi:MAG TPA: response regulator transcription factor [Candidatus Aminicenantes bacterium]|nr:response regulator transcription factor [Candidatus Aminicenantes bacterium]